MSLKDDLLKLVSRYTGGRVGYDDGGTVSTSDILRDMSPGAITRDIEPGPDVRRRLQDQAMRGVEITPLQREQLRLYLADLDRRRAIRAQELGPEDAGAAIHGLAKTLAPPIPGWNFPSYEESKAEFENKTAANAARRDGMPESTRALDLAKEYAMEAAPFAIPGMVQKGAPMAAAALRSLPKSAYAGLPLAGGLFAPSEAGERGAEDPRHLEIRQKQDEIEKLRNELRKMGTVSFQSTVAREKASEPYLQSIAAAQRRIDQLNTDMRHDALKATSVADEERKRIVGEAADKRDAVLRDAPKPFSKSWPTVSEWMPYAPMIAAGITGAGLGLKRGLSERNAAQAWEGALERAASPTRKPLGRETAGLEAEKIAERWPEKGATAAGLSKMSDYAAPAVLGATEGAFIPHLPYFYNALKLDKENPERASMQTYYRNLPEGDPEAQRVKRLLDDESALPRGNPAKEEALDYFKDPSSMITRTMLGAGEGAAATLPGTTLGKMIAPGSKELDVLRARTDAIRSGRGRLEPPEGGQQGSPSSAPLQLSPEPPTATPPRVALPPPLAEVVPQRSLPGAAMEPSVPATVSSEPPKLPKGYTWNDLGVGSKIHGPDGRFSTMDLVNAKTKAKRSKKSEPDDDLPSAGKLNGQDVPKKPDRVLTEEDFKGRADGGRVLALARRYADGGSVIAHGLVPGATPGRADALDVEVPNGAYVLPADVVSAMGEGNTAAGAEAWKQILPPTQGDAYANGGTIPIMISDGEIVVNPDQVAQIGGGDLQHGHRILDQAVRKVRADHIAKLQSLPPPAKS